jgi:putative flippase GtrA
VARLYAVLRASIREIAKFGVIGIAAYALTVLISNWLRFGGPHFGPLSSLGLATVVAATASYFANRHWTWSHTHRNGVAREYSLFILLSAVGLAITEVPVGVSEYVFGLHSQLSYNIAGNIIGTVFGTVWRFCSFKRWIFLEAEPIRDTEAKHAALI